MNNDLLLLEPEYRYHAQRAREALRPVRYRRWRRRTTPDGQSGVTDAKNWIN